jgi:hypothetical protein
MASSYLFNQQQLAALGVAPGPAFVERPRALQDDDLPHTARESQGTLPASSVLAAGGSSSLQLPPPPQLGMLLQEQLQQQQQQQQVQQLHDSNIKHVSWARHGLNGILTPSQLSLKELQDVEVGDCRHPAAPNPNRWGSQASLGAIPISGPNFRVGSPVLQVVFSAQQQEQPQQLDDQQLQKQESRQQSQLMYTHSPAYNLSAAQLRQAAVTRPLSISAAVAAAAAAAPARTEDCDSGDKVTMWQQTAATLGTVALPYFSSLVSPTEMIRMENALSHAGPSGRLQLASSPLPRPRSSAVMPVNSTSDITSSRRPVRPRLQPPLLPTVGHGGELANQDAAAMATFHTTPLPSMVADGTNGAQPTPPTSSGKPVSLYGMPIQSSTFGPEARGGSNGGAITPSAGSSSTPAASGGRPTSKPQLKDCGWVHGSTDLAFEDPMVNSPFRSLHIGVMAATAPNDSNRCDDGSGLSGTLGESSAVDRPTAVAGESKDIIAR